jgi:hypothetical protein
MWMQPSPSSSPASQIQSLVIFLSSRLVCSIVDTEPGGKVKITYVAKKFKADYTQMIDRANTIVAEYAAAGYDLTLRQL